LQSKESVNVTGFIFALLFSSYMNDLNRLLNTYAYNITGSYEDARDIVQDAFENLMKIGEEHIADKKNYLIRSVINLSINFKKRQKKFVEEHYRGIWLPEPVATDKADTPLLRKETLSYSLLVLLDKLNPKQRAVFILKEAFGYDHEEIAQVLGITEENSRKLLSRGHEQLKKHRAETMKTIRSDYFHKYLEAIENADMPRLEKLLHDDIHLLSDGGGKVSASLKPIAGKERVMKFLSGVYRKFYQDVQIEPVLVNHQPALLYYHGGVVVNCQVFSFSDGLIENVFFVRNPDKLKMLQKNISKVVT
jgi:RNA polymerase sigma-70 factor (ECF subfamily)